MASAFLLWLCAITIEPLTKGIKLIASKEALAQTSLKVHACWWGWDSLKFWVTLKTV